MTIYVNIGEAEKRLAELVAAAVRGEDVVLSNDGVPKARIVKIAPAVVDPERSDAERERIHAKRLSAIGMWAREMAGFDLSIEELKADRDPDRRERKIRGVF